MITWDTLEGGKDWQDSEDDYNAQAFAVIAQLEGTETRPYLDTAHLPSIGIGFNLADEGVRTVVLDAMGLTDALVGAFRTDIEAVLSEGEWGEPGFLQADLRDALDEIIEDANSAEVTAKTDFSMTLAEMEDAFPVVAIGKEDVVDEWLADIPESRERTVLLSLAYNQRPGHELLGDALHDAIEAGDRAEAWYEIRYNSNAGSLNAPPPDDADAVAKRRYVESQVFGLHEKVDSSAVDWSTADALAVFEMFNRHEEKILAYDNRYGGPGASYGNQIAAADTDLSAIETNSGEDFGTVLARNDAFAPARDYLAAVYLSFDEGHIGEGEAALDVGLAAWGSGENSLRADLEDLRGELVANEADTTNVDRLLGMQINLQEVFVASGTAVAGEVAAHTVDRSSIESLAGVTDDLIFGTNGVDTLLAGNGDDVIVGSAGSDSIFGGDGVDAVSYAESGAGVSVDLDGGTASGGDAAGDTLGEIENVIGSGYGDVLIGDENDNVLVGLNGSDSLAGGEGDDILHGGAGTDTIAGGLGTDYLFGGAGADRFIIDHDGSGSSEVPDIIIDADSGDRAILDELVLTGGTRDLYYLTVDEFENEVWVANEEQRWLADEDGMLDYRMEGDDLTINIFNEGGEYFERVIIKDWEFGDLGLDLVNVDNRY